MPDPVLLIHGAWQGSWTWKRLTPLMQARGLEPIALDLPGNGYDDVPAADVTLDLYLDHIGSILDWVDGPVSLVGHSGGGVVATAAAERFAERVSRIAYIAGMMLPPGMGFYELQKAHGGPSGISPFLEWSEDRLTNWASQEKALEIFYHDCDPDVATDAVDRLRPQPLGGFALVAEPTPERFGQIPRLYVETTGDRSVLIGLQRHMQQLVPGANIVSLDTGHVPQLSAPEAVAALLCPFLLAETRRAAA